MVAWQGRIRAARIVAAARRLTPRQRRTALLAVMMVVVAITGIAASEAGRGRFDPRRVKFAPADTVLCEMTPQQAGLNPRPIREAERRLDRWTGTGGLRNHPLFAGAVGMLVHDGMIIDTTAVGSAVRYADARGTELPRDRRVPMRPDTIFDLASLTKLFTSIAVMQLVERGEVDLTAPVAHYLPEFAVNGKQHITVEQLLTHTSGLQPDLKLWRYWPNRAARLHAVLEVAPQTTPGTHYTYSDLNLITLGMLVHRVTGKTLDTVVRQRITAPLGMTDTGYRPPPAKRHRIAATEYQSDPPRGMLRGEVHDENAWALGGVAGHAGMFSTARDLAVLGQALLNGGNYAGARILRPDTVRAMFTNYTAAFTGEDHGLGIQVNQPWYMGGLASPVAVGHTGYTGTSLVIDPMSGSIAILLTNRVHPSRAWGSINVARQAWATSLARALAVHR
jgi:CubicO group peptidase (beta-lactamase class C family)